MRSTTMLIASVAVTLAACGPMTIQLAPPSPTTPMVEEKEDDASEQGERQYGGNPDRPDPHADDKPAEDADDKPALPPDTPNPPPFERPDPDADEPDADDPPTGGGPNIHPPAPHDPPTPQDPPTPPTGRDEIPDPIRPRDEPPVTRPHIPAERPQPQRPDSVGSMPREHPGRGEPARPPHIQPERPERPEHPEPEHPDTEHAARDIHIPPGHMPSGEACRLWIEGTPPGRQAAPVPCAQLHGAVPEGAFVLYRDRAWDTLYDWVALEQRTPGSVPEAILALMRSL